MQKVNLIGRKKEAGFLEERYRKRSSEFIVVYGRRRVGKSTLLRAFSGNKRCLFHVGDRSTAHLQIKKVLQEAAEILNEPLMRDLNVSDWRRLFEILTPHLLKTKMLLILDEFQWMCESAPALPSVLQEVWDKTWERSGKVFLVLCGSYVGFMEREVLGKKSPLYGRRTAQIFLKPLPYREAALFHPDENPEGWARIHGICGGVPAYLLAFQQDRSVETNILTECLEDEGRLREEPRFLMMEELREPAIYYSILESLNTRRLGITELGALLNQDKSGLVYYLNTLQHLGYVGKVISLGKNRGAAPRGQYHIRDALLRFWFSQVYPNLTDLTLREPKDVFLSKVRPRLDHFWGKQFEILCREAVPSLLAGNRVTCSFQVGVYWDRKMQIDLVVEREDGITQIAECKWLKNPVGMDVVNELKRKIQEYPNPKNHALLPHLFSRSGFTEAVKSEPKLQLTTLKEIYKDIQETN